ncbi:MAG: hypothetical protein K2K21_13165 [Lachnospiraceae bacterium]|nr:hypothetical protein [Lachnospiraceae bacterium]
MDALTGTKEDETPGLLKRENDGVGDEGGYIYLSFQLNDIASDKDLIYGDNLNLRSLSSIGSITMRIGVAPDDTEEKVLKKITETLNDSTIVDLFNSSATDYARYNSTIASVNPGYNVEVPVYGDVITSGKQYFWVQAGAEAGQHIDIEYDALSLYALGMQKTDVLTVESASRAIDEVKGAIQIVSEQRSLFGAYQNRLEHAYNINKNVEENTQSAESLIRDTDIADMMMEYSINNILLQAGTSMLAQANQSSQRILELLS